MKKKIVFLVKDITNQGGDTRSVCIRANGLATTYDIIILSLFQTNDKPVYFIDKSIKRVHLFKTPFSIRRNYFKALKSFREFCEKNVFDILIVEGIGFNTFTYPIIRGEKIKVISVEHASFFDGGNRFGLAWFGRKIACNKSNCLVVLTKTDLEAYKVNIKKVNRIAQIYNPLDPSINTNPYKINSKKIISCGRLVHVKGYDMLLKIAKNVFQVHPDWEWHIYGDGPQKTELLKMINNLGLQKNVKLQGKVKNIYEMYSNYSFCVLTSRVESFGMVLIEALKSGIPVISFDCKNGPGEIVKNGLNGYLIPSFDLDIMTEKILLLIENQELRSEIAENSPNSLKEFDVSKILLEWDRLIKSI